MPNHCNKYSEIIASCDPLVEDLLRVRNHF